MPGGLFDDWILRSLKLQLGYGTLPDSSKFYLIICTGATWGSGATKTQVLATELPLANGYARFNVLVTENELTFASGIAQTPPKTFSLTASGQSLQWNGVALLADAAATGTDGTLVAGWRDQEQTIFAGATHSFQWDMGFLSQGGTW